MQGVSLSDSHPSGLPERPLLSSVPPSLRLRFLGDGTEFFILILKNVLLTIVTFGIYAAWAKTERRKFMWRNTEVGGYLLDFTGTGWELLKGYLVVFGVYAVLVGTVITAELVSKGLGVVVQVVFALALIVLIPFAIYRSRAYLLSRTSWRGVRFNMVEGAGEFIRVFVAGNLLTLVTLGIYFPFWVNNITAVLTRNSRFGQTRFAYDGVGSELFWIYLKGILLSIVTLGIYSFWLHAEVTRYTLRHTSFMDARGNSELTGGTLLGLTLLSLFGTTLTLGLAFPWIATYSLRTVLSKISFEGHIDFAAVLAGAANAGATGDAMADALDVGLGL